MTRASAATARLGRLVSVLGPVLALIVLIAGTALIERLRLEPGQRAAFLTLGNMINILRQSAPTGVVAIGMTFVMISAGIDLSVGAIVALAGGLGIMVMNACAVSGWDPGWSVAAGIGSMLAISTGLGLINGSLVAFAKIAPFIATLSTLAAYRSLATALVKGGNFSSSLVMTEARDWRPILPDHEWEPVLSSISSGGLPLGQIAGQTIELPYLVITFLFVTIVGGLLLRATVYGLRVRAVGDNEKAAMYAALPVRRVRLLTYGLCGLTCGIAAAMSAARGGGSISSGQTGMLYELDAIAAVVIGGTRMQGGSGRVWGTFVGVLILGVIQNMLNMLGVGAFYTGLVKGLVIVAAVLLQRGGAR
jgi:ribose transport system permease protein